MDYEAEIIKLKKEVEELKQKSSILGNIQLNTEAGETKTLYRIGVKTPDGIKSFWVEPTND